MPQRNITLTPELDQWIDAEMKSGFYSNVSEFVRDALRNFQRLRARENYEDQIIEMKIQRGIEDWKAGRGDLIQGKEELESFFAQQREARKAALQNRAAE